MKQWITVAPWFINENPEWIPKYIELIGHKFIYVPANYEHDRSRNYTSLNQWIDYLKHGVRAWFKKAPWDNDVGYITAFPQLPIILGLIKKIIKSERHIIAWMFNLGQTYGGIKGKLARYSLRNVNYFIVHSRAEIYSYSQWLDIPKERFIFVPLAIKIRTVTYSENFDAPFVFAMGSANRDYRLLFAAVEKLGYRTIVVASEHATAGLRRPANVSILKNLSLEECHRLCQQAKVNVIPVDNSVTASGQVTLLETMMYGKALVATRCAGTVDYIEDGKTALLVDGKDLTALGDAIEDLWNSPEKRRQLGVASKEYIENNVSFAGVASAMAEILSRKTT
jgi:glycosyltransferase involved in cell wall biosynthesis